MFVCATGKERKKGKKTLSLYLCVVYIYQHLIGERVSMKRFVNLPLEEQTHIELKVLAVKKGTTMAKLFEAIISEFIEKEIAKNG